MAKSVPFVLNMLETLFWCLSLGIGAWEIHWDNFQTPHIGLSGQNGHLWPFWVSQNKLEWPNLYLWALVLNMLETRFWCLSLGFGPWENHWDHFQTPQIGLSGQNGHLWPYGLAKIS